MDSVGWILGIGAVFAPLLMQFIFAFAAVVLCLKVRATSTAIFAVGAVLGTVGLVALRTAGPPLGAYSTMVHAIASILQTVGFLWFVLALPKRQEQLTQV